MAVVNKLFTFLFFLALSTAIGRAYAEGFTSTKKTDTIQIYVRDDVYKDYLNFLSGRSPLEINNFKGSYIRRDVVDMILAQQALLLGGFDKPFEYQTGNVNFRNTKLLENGKLLLSMDSYWLADAKHYESFVYISQPLIERGDYYAGIFYSPDNKKMQTLNRFEDFKGLSSVSTPRWRTDWKTLSNLPLKELITEHEWVSQARMVDMKWADFMLMPLMPSLKNEYILADIKLVAHPKLVVLLDGSRHLVVSKHHPDGKTAFVALQKGLKKLKAQGAIRKAYKEAGFIPDFAKYTVINKP